jgi:di/tricarboxylate transporter
MLAAIYLLTQLFTELLANGAAAALVFPIAPAWTAAAGLHFLPLACRLPSPRPPGSRRRSGIRRI